MSQSSPAVCPSCGAALEIISDGEIAEGSPMTPLRLRALKDAVQMAEVDINLQKKAVEIKEANEKLAEHILRYPTTPTE